MSFSARTALRIAAVTAALAVVLGAFGAHGLKARLEPAELEVWKTGVLYHMVHALALVALSLAALSRESALKGWRGPWICWLAGIFLFSGSLYGLSVAEGMRWLGPVTPIGGLLFVIGWLWLAIKG